VDRHSQSPYRQMARKLYTEEQIAHYLAVLRSNGQNYKQTSRQTGVARGTLRRWEVGQLPGAMDQERIAKGTNAISEALAEQFGRIAVKSLESAEGKIADASYRDLLIGAGISTEKRELLRGGPTSRVNTQIMVSLVASDGRSYAGLQGAAQAAIDGEYKALPDTIPQRQPESDPAIP
jgi:hypothetical protein